VEIALYISEQFGWFEFNRHKNWAVLVNAAVVVTGLFVISLWVVCGALLRRKPQFGLRTLIVLVCVVSAACGWFGGALASVNRDLGVLQWLVDQGVSPAGCYEVTILSTKGKCERFKGCGLAFSWVTDENTPEILRTWLGDAFFGYIDPHVTFEPTEAQTAGKEFESLKKLRQLSRLTLAGPHVTDSVLARLGELPKLNCLKIRNASISNEGLRSLLVQSSISELCLKDVSIDDTGFRHIEALKDLVVLDLKGAEITDAAMGRLGCLKNLRLIFLGDTFVTDKGVAELESALPQCIVTFWGSRSSEDAKDSLVSESSEPQNDVDTAVP
jgi:hypothetical protein